MLLQTKKPRAAPCTQKMYSKFTLAVVTSATLKIYHLQPKKKTQNIPKKKTQNIPFKLPNNYIHLLNK